MITGASNLSNAMGGGKLAARRIDDRLMGESRWDRLFPEFEFNRKTVGTPSQSSRHVARSLDASLRARTQDEVVGALSRADAVEECRRCLRCELRATTAED